MFEVCVHPLRNPWEKIKRLKKKISVNRAEANTFGKVQSEICGVH